MALISCNECGTDISTSAKACPKCGWRPPRAAIWPWLVGVPVAIFMAILISGMMIPEYEAQARRVRKVCEQIAAGRSYMLTLCEKQYYEALEKGRADAKAKARQQTGQ